jgi:hypothetical protein
MINCHECGVPQLEGSVFCLECGASLFQKTADTSAQFTTVLPFQQTASPSQLPPVAKVGKPLEAGQKQLAFVIPSSRRRVALLLKEQLYIGRTDPEAGAEPELDLTGDGGENLGVSRIHAVIQLTEEGIILRDLNSTNGTLLNNHLLEPETPYLLSSGDEIHFGNLLVHVLFDRG